MTLIFAGMFDVWQIWSFYDVSIFIPWVWIALHRWAYKRELVRVLHGHCEVVLKPEPALAERPVISLISNGISMQASIESCLALSGYCMWLLPALCMLPPWTDNVPWIAMCQRNVQTLVLRLRQTLDSDGDSSAKHCAQILCETR